MGLIRRQLLERLGLAGGVSAVYLGMEAMGLLNAPPAAAEPFALPPVPGRRKSVVILGAGEHLSYVRFWQEGAALSSHAAMQALQARVQEQALSERGTRRAVAA